MDNEKFQSIGNVINTWGSQNNFKVVLKPFLKLNPHKKIKILFYSNNDINYLPLKILEFQPQGNYYKLKLNNKIEIINPNVLKNRELYSLIANDEFINENWWKDYQVELEDCHYKIKQIWNNGHYDLVEINYHEKDVWIPLVGEYLNFINHDRKLIYLNKVGVLNEI